MNMVYEIQDYVQNYGFFETELCAKRYISNCYENQNHARFCEKHDYQHILITTVQSWWVSELPASLFDCPFGLMWVAVPCCETDIEFLVPAEKEAVDGVCEVDQCLVADMLHVLESGVFVEPLPDQIAIVYEYQQVQVTSFKQVIAGKTRDFF